MDLIKKLHNIIEEGDLWDGEILLKRNQFLKVAKSIDTNLYYVISGSIKISVISENNEHIIRFGYKNNFTASLDSFISEKPSDFCIQAIKETKLKFITKKTHTKLINHNTDNQLLWTSILEQMVVQQLERERDLLMFTPKERFEKVFQRSPHLFQEIPKKHIASYLRMTPETLSRLEKS
ncbi:Crp/Fnr family transcriptional regulator [Aquimarina sp. MMG016]|uniref:Crp/Fnr family transcriptional regulator n=1 Tax=Aquimarina sp. MMG016 TaxID=2822690 RepID=UPI001B39EDE1|nr:Crp/Fnr family transcriptional regulator [Aquimarina sp. MMG016]MBQ4820271.1 Crp/Fnr family transcriptional regulator [Aquimarina sp. MMG016]